MLLLIQLIGMTPIGFYHFADYVRGIAEGMGIKIRWGSDWNGNFDLKDQNFYDLLHFEVKGQ